MAEMDAVNSFNAELQSLYEVKPPISKGKMTAVTRAALKGVKLYKHVVQSVEKFIQKCKTEYKIPGLYVIDSIIRQSRHQFGAEKDVFAPRFARNLQTTFMHLYKCPEEDKAKVIRVLNLWQKNKIFTPELIQPLFDLADPNNPIWEQLLLQQEQNVKAAQNSSMNSGGQGSSGIPSVLSNLPSTPFKKEILDYDYGDDDEGGDSRNTQNPPEGNYPQPTQNSHVGFDALGSILANPEILRQLATLQEQIAAATSQPSTGGYPTPEQERQRKMAELNKQEAAFDQRLAQTVARLPFAVDCDMPMGEDGKSPRRDSSVDQNSNQLGNNHGQSHQLLPPPFFQQINDQNQQGSHQSQQQQQHQQLLNFLGQQHQDGQNPFGLNIQFPPGVQFPPPHQDLSQAMSMFASQPPPDVNQSFSGFNQSQGPVEIDLTDDSKDKDRRDRRRKRSRSRRSRSTSRSRLRKSRSRSRGRKRYRSRSRDRKEEKERDREKEKERVRKGFPTLKKEHLSVCSTTLWVGHLSKLVSQEELSDTFGAYGDIISIDLIAPRGCAFIVMNRRQDSLRALDRLRNTKLQGKTITLAWAPGKGMKGREWKDYWEVDTGVSYIPWQKLRPDLNVEEFEDGGCIDEDTLPDFLKHRPKPPDQDKGAPPLPEMIEDSQDVPTSNASNTPQMSLLPNSGMGGGLPDSVPKLGGDSEARSDLSLAVQANPNPISGMPNPPFGMPPPVGMMPNMPMGMPMGMVPPPMLGPGMPGFPGMGLPGMPMMGSMGMMPPNMGMGGPPMGGPGLLGDMPATSLANLTHINNMQQLTNSGMHLDSNPPRSERGPPEDDEKKRFSDRREGKRRSRFDDPEDSRNSVSMEDVEKNSPSQSSDSKDDQRPVFERLKSLAEGYGFGGGDKPPSLLGTPGGPPMGGMGPRGPGDRMPGPRGFPQSLLPHGPGNQFGPRGPFMGDRPRVPGGPQRPWFEPQNPFLNPNPFAGNPFIQGNMTENPFEIGGPPRGEVDPNLAGPGGPAPLFGSPPERGGFGGRGGRGGWNMDRGGRGGGRGNWRDDAEPDREGSRDRDRDRGMWGGRGGRGGPRDSWGGREDRDRDRDRDRGGRRDDRDRSRGSRERDSRDRRDRRDRSRDRDSNFRDRRRRSTETEDDRREGRSSERQPRDKPKEESLQFEEENWEEDEETNSNTTSQQDIKSTQSTQNNDSQRADDEAWEDTSVPNPERVQDSEFVPRPQDDNWDEDEAVPSQSKTFGSSQDSQDESNVHERYEQGDNETNADENVVTNPHYDEENAYKDRSQEDEQPSYPANEDLPSSHQIDQDESSFQEGGDDLPNQPRDFDSDQSNFQHRNENLMNNDFEVEDTSNRHEEQVSSPYPPPDESISHSHSFEEERRDQVYEDHHNEAPSNHHEEHRDDPEENPNYSSSNSENMSSFPQEDERDFRSDKPHQDYPENNSHSWSNNGNEDHNNHNNSESTHHEDNDVEESFNDIDNSVSEHNNIYPTKNLITSQEGPLNNCSEGDNTEEFIPEEANSNNIDLVDTNEIGNGPS